MKVLKLFAVATLAATPFLFTAPVAVAADAYTTVVRGVPELLIIYLVFFGGGTLLRTVASGVFGYDGYVDPSSVTQALAIGARQHGARFMRNTRVLEMHGDDQRVTHLKTNTNQLISADVVVLAAGMLDFLDGFNHIVVHNDRIR